MKRLGLVVAVVMAVAVATASAAVTFELGPTFNMFGNSQVSGSGNTVKIGFPLDNNAVVGVRMEQQNLTITAADNTINTTRMSNQLTLLTLDKKVSEVSKELPVTVGFELGSVTLQSLAGTCPAVATLNQVAPVAGIDAGIKYEVSGKTIVTAILLNVGYRFIAINHVADPVGVGLGDQALKDLSGLRIDLGLSVTF